MKFKWVKDEAKPKVTTPAPFAVKAKVTDIPEPEAPPAAENDAPPASPVAAILEAMSGTPQPASRPKAVVSDIPTLHGDAAEAVAHRDGHIQIIASAGSGKTEVVAQRVASLLVEGELPESIVAFTFTEKAASELKERIRERVTALQGEAASDQLGRLFVGTIHAYCFRMLQTYVPKYETYTPLDANQLTNLLYRESYLLGIKNLTLSGGTFRKIAGFQRGVDVIENELIDLGTLPADDPFTTAIVEYYAMLERYQFMSFGTQIVRAVEALQRPEVHGAVTAPLRHLVVDEYQDVNPAQERLIELLAKPNGTADVVVVGDDDQAIYQWRGSSVDNIVTFADRYPDVTQFRLLTNRRSRPGVVNLANLFAETIDGRIDKEMNPFREGEGPSVAIATVDGTEANEAAEVAQQIVQFHEKGLPYNDIAILVRGRTAYPAILNALAASGIPVQSAGRTGLFQQPEPELFAATYAWFGDVEWAAEKWTNRESVTAERLLTDYTSIFGLDSAARAALESHLPAWKEKALASDFNESLVGDFYDLVALLGVDRWDLSNPLIRNRLGTIARFTNVLADYEGVAWRSRRDADAVGEQIGARSGGEWFYRNFAILLANYANGSYDDFGGEEDLLTDGVALGTVHGSKGLEWPVVFLPSLVKSRFPSSRNGTQQDWPAPLLGRFDRTRYEGTLNDERRLFYVAITRARDAILLSAHTHQKGGKRRNASDFFSYVVDNFAGAGTPTSAQSKGTPADPELTLTYSELAAYEECPRSYLLKSELGFMPTIQPELGYGNAVHHLMRVLAEKTKATGTLPTSAQVTQLLDSDFFLPYANKAGHRQMKESARRLVDRYVADHPDDLLRTWATERPFELYLDGVVVSGRADVILDEHNGKVDSLAIVDYKTATGEQLQPLQLQVYADAGRREGLDVSGAFIHDLGTTDRHPIDVSAASVAAAEQQVLITVDSLRRREFDPKPERSKCRRCDVRALCSAAKKK